MFLDHRPVYVKAKKKGQNNWIIGLPQYLNEGKDANIIVDTNHLEAVETETICQFTGLLDSEKKMIFENDVVVDDKGNDWQVIFNKIIGMYRLKKINGPGERNIFPLNEKYKISFNLHDKTKEYE